MKKSNLDEMQEQNLLRIEHNGYWLAFWGLVVAMVIQMIVGGAQAFQHMLGEFIILMSLCAYTVIACIKHGIWDRRLAPNFKTNLLMSLGTGIVMGIATGISAQLRFNPGPISIILIGIITFTSTAGLCLVALTLAKSIYTKKLKKINTDLEKESE